MKPIARVWTFRSESNPRKTYETLQYTDATVSCNCPGWTRRCAADGTRSCKHTRLVHQGLADPHCESHHDYANAKPNQTEIPRESQTIPTTPIQFSFAGTRKFHA